MLKYWDSWTAFFQEAGLESKLRKTAESKDLLEAAYEVFIENKGIPTSIRFFRLCKYSKQTYRKRWHTYAGFLSAFKDWIKEYDPSFPYYSDLEVISTIPNEIEIYNEEKKQQSATKAWNSHTRRSYGSFLNFRGLQHTPINEQGVVFLFGMVAFELGYVVESIATGFPDCEAKRRTSISKDIWERVRIEFEYESKNFIDHGHNSEVCDVIVCWNHNWQDCPIEVLELSSAIQELEDDVE